IRQAVVNCVDFGVVGRIQRETQIGASPLEITGNRVGSPYHHGFVHYLWVPGEAKARLKVAKPPVVRIVKGTVVAVKSALPGYLDLATEWSKIHLAVFHLHPGRVCLITETHVES